MRGYFRSETLARELDALCISFDRSICPGYGWIFPGPNGVFNVGAGYFFDAPRRPAVGNVRQVFASFVERFPLARQLLAEAEPLGELKGAPLRTALKGARLARPGLLVAGEAAGSTYSFSGEGIGKALETGILAAEHAFDFFSGKLTATTLGPAYQQSLAEALAPRFAAYETAQQWLSYPVACDFITARAADDTSRCSWRSCWPSQATPASFFVERTAQGAGGLSAHPASSAALPPAAVVLTVTVCSAQKRYR
ncbi:hypothetical protein LP417_11850 [Polaromonas sp. P1-6]|nr:hypothetical protein LP417_11850 [Polaromonas sp. P1-6]